MVRQRPSTGYPNITSFYFRHISALTWPNGHTILLDTVVSMIREAFRAKMAKDGKKCNTVLIGDADTTVKVIVLMIFWLSLLSLGHPLSEILVKLLMLPEIYIISFWHSLPQSLDFKTIFLLFLSFPLQLHLRFPLRPFYCCCGRQSLFFS